MGIQITQDFSSQINAINNAVSNAMKRTFYVDVVNGDDVNDGSAIYPFATLKKAIDSIPVGGKGTIYIKEGQDFDVTTTINLENKKINIYRWGATTGVSNPRIVHYPRANGHYEFNIINSRVFAMDVDFKLLEATDTTSSKYIGAFMLDFGSIDLLRCNIELDSSFISYFAVSDGYYEGFGVVGFTDCSITTYSKGYVFYLKDNSSGVLKTSGTSMVIDDSNYWVTGIIKDTNGVPRNVLSNIIL